MDRSGASAYIYAKSCGMLARSYVGERAVKLFSARSLSELWPLVVKSEVPAVPETLLARQLEESAAAEFISDYIKLVSFYDRPAEILITLLEYYDFENLKSLGAAAAMGQKKRPLLHDISPYNILHYDEWPDIEKITEGTELSWYNKVPGVAEQQQLDSELDIQFIQKIWRSSQSLHGNEKAAVRKLLVKRYSMRNLLWVLRLKVYYKMDAGEIVKRLAFLNPEDGENDLLAGDALKVIHKNIEHYEDWAGWKYAPLLNPHEEGSVWCVNPRWVEESFEKDFLRESQKLFHAFPFSPVVLISWFFIKAKELDYIRSATEALCLSIEPVQAMDAMGIKEMR